MAVYLLLRAYKILTASSSEMLLRVLTLSSFGPFRDYDEMEKFGSKEVIRPSKKTFITRRNSWISDIAA